MNSGSATIASVSASATFFGDADDEQDEAARQVLPHLRPARVGAELVDDLVVPHERPGDELREEGDEHAEVEEAVDVPVAAPQVDQVGDLLEHEEADAERQDQVPGVPALAEQREDGAAEEVGIFEQRPAPRG